MLWIPNDINDIVVLVLAVLLDLVVGELPNKFHPTAWMGKTVTLVEKLAPRNATGQLVFGICMALVIPGFWAAAAYLAVQGLRDLDDLAYLLVGAALLKTTFSVKMLRQAAAKIQKSLIHGDLMQARAGLSSLVSRNGFYSDLGAGNGGHGGVGIGKHHRQLRRALAGFRSLRPAWCLRLSSYQHFG